VTTKEIADAVNRSDRSVRNWIKRVAENNAVMAEKMAASTSTNPADFTLDETIAIIRKGLGVNAADLFAENAISKTHDVPQSEPFDYEKLAMLIATAVTTAIASVAGVAKEQQLQIEAPLTHQTLLGYCNAHEIDDADNTNRLRSHGLVLRGICTQRRLGIKRIAHERYGTVNSYPVEVLDEYFSI